MCLTLSHRYVEMLEQQQGQLVTGLQETYRRLIEANLWPGAPLSESEGHPLTHDILARLNIISQKADTDDMFEEDCEKLQQRLLSQGAPYMARRGSVSSESEHGHPQTHKRSRSMIDSPIVSPSKPSFRKSFDFDRTRTASPVNRSPAPLQTHSRSVIKPSPLHNESPLQDNMPSIDDDVLYSTFDWQNFGPVLGNQHFDSPFAFQQQPSFTGGLSSSDNWSGFESHPVQFDSSLLGNFAQQNNSFNMQSDWQNTEPPAAMDVDFSKFVQVAT